jgi:hypothetical protein
MNASGPEFGFLYTGTNDIHKEPPFNVMLNEMNILLHAAFKLGLIFDLEDGGNIFPRNVG